MRGHGFPNIFQIFNLNKDKPQQRPFHKSHLYAIRWKQTQKS